MRLKAAILTVLLMVPVRSFSQTYTTMTAYTATLPSTPSTVEISRLSLPAGALNASNRTADIYSVLNVNNGYYMYGQLIALLRLCDTTSCTGSVNVTVASTNFTANISYPSFIRITGTLGTKTTGKSGKLVTDIRAEMDGYPGQNSSNPVFIGGTETSPTVDLTKAYYLVVAIQSTISQSVSPASPVSVNQLTRLVVH